MQPTRVGGPITYATKLFYGFGSIAYGVKDQGFSYLLLIYYNQVLGLPVQWVGFALLMALVLDAVLDPIVGNWSDRLHSRFGRRHPFMYAAAVPVALSYMLLWDPPAGLSQGALFAYLVVVAIIVRIFITFYEIPSSALAPELTENYDQRTSFLAYRYFFGWAGGLTMATLAFSFFLVPDETHPTGTLNPIGYAHYGFAAGGLMLVAILISAAGTHRHIPDLKAPPPKRLVSLRQIAAEMLSTLSHRSFLMVLIAGVFSSMALGLTTSLTYYFTTYFWELTSKQLTVINLGYFISAVVAVPLSGILSRLLGKKRAAITVWILSTVIYPLPFLLRLAGLFPENGSPLLLPALFCLGTIAVGFFIAAAILVASMIADVVEDSQLTTGRRSEGLFFAANSFIQKCVSGVGTFLSSLLLGLIAFPSNAKPGEVPGAVLEHLVLVYIVAIVVLYICAMLVLSTYRISRDSHEANLKRLAAATEEIAAE
ncbi:MAG TPA: MFS transporter [Aliidongia sp.]|nr:MFS transporter [Aliidongia sp.]